MGYSIPEPKPREYVQPAYSSATWFQSPYDRSLVLLMEYAPGMHVLEDGENVRTAYHNACRAARQMARYGASISEDTFIWQKRMDAVNNSRAF